MANDTSSSSVRAEIPYFQTPNSIFDLDIEVIAEQRSKIKGVKEVTVVKRPMKPHEKLVYIYMCRCGNNGGQAFPSYDKIAEKCGISRSSAIEVIKVLEKNNLIVKNYRQKLKSNEQDSNEYIILDPKKECEVEKCGMSSELPSVPSTPHVVCHADYPSMPSTPPSVPGEPPLVCQADHPSVPGTPKKEPFKKNHIKKNHIRIYSLVVDYLNEKAGTSFKSTSKKTKQLITARLSDEFEIEDFYKVIDNKVFDWKGTEWEKYLRPETLFGAKFESYLNQKVIKPERGDKGGGTRPNYDPSTQSCEPGPYDFTSFGG